MRKRGIGRFTERTRLRVGLVLGILTALPGCGPGLATVTGKVTLGSKPLGGATIAFVPVVEGEGMTTVASTNDNGDFTLRQSADSAGIPPGSYRVHVSTYQEADPDANPPRKQVNERVPTRYNLASELTAEVKAGENRFDFPLEPKGEIHQPR